MPNTVAPNPSIPIINENAEMTQVFKDWTQLVTRFDLIVGTGSPEGVVEAEQARIYLDDIGTAGNILYVKRDPDITGDRKLGWILI